jgi:hypothetical protein
MRVILKVPKRYIKEGREKEDKITRTQHTHTHTHAHIYTYIQREREVWTIEKRQLDEERRQRRVE